MRTTQPKKKKKTVNNLKIAGHMTPGDRKILRDHYKSIKDPKHKAKEAVRLNKMYNKYGMHFGA